MSHASENCADCDRLSADYESATIRWFRLDSQMQIAEFGRDPEASSMIARERAMVDDRRQALKRALHEHVQVRHGRSIRAAA